MVRPSSRRATTDLNAPSPDLSDDQELQPLQSIRKRTRRPCEVCKRRKRRCDGGQPCRACVEFEYDCFYHGAASTAIETSDQAQLRIQPEQTPPMVESPNSKLDPNIATSKQARMTFPQLVIEATRSGRISAEMEFCYNFGLKRVMSRETLGVVRLKDVFTMQEARIYCNEYTTSCNKMFPVINDNILRTQLDMMMNEPQSQSLKRIPVVELTVALAVLLGFYISGQSLTDQHLRLLSLIQNELDTLTFQNNQPLVWLLRSWILRTLLLRFCYEPTQTWLSSCMMMHIAELLNLHPARQLSNQYERTEDAAVEDRRRLIRLSWVLNQFISLETDNTPVFLAPLASSEDEVETSPTLLRLITILNQPSFDQVATSISAAQTCIYTICQQHIQNSSITPPHLAMLEASILCHLCRLVFQHGGSLDTNIAVAAKPVFQSALDAADKLIDEQKPWFMLASGLPQIMCVCLRLDRHLSHLLPKITSLISKAYSIFDSAPFSHVQIVVKVLVEALLEARQESVLVLQNTLQSLAMPDNRSVTTSAEEELWATFLNQQIFE